ncbi:MAG: RNase adaptor protein RapZ, partial [Desulfuromonadales bacterium]|nr:RNase adaptor protein RapZ [Desulfuromonadales bacterium]
VVATVCGKEAENRLAILLQSFGFRYGIPVESDLVMDVRFLQNPHFVPELQPLSGQDKGVSRFVLDQPVTRQFMTHFSQLLDFLIPHYRREGKNYLTISVGCTGGRHRSVAIVEELSTLLPGDGVVIKTAHRDLDRGIA